MSTLALLAIIAGHFVPEKNGGSSKGKELKLSEQKTSHTPSSLSAYPLSPDYNLESPDSALESPDSAIESPDSNLDSPDDQNSLFASHSKLLKPTSKKFHPSIKAAKLYPDLNPFKLDSDEILTMRIASGLKIMVMNIGNED